MSDETWPAVPAGWVWTGTSDAVTIVAPFGTGEAPNECRVYWGSHGCDLERGHPGGRRAHDCRCCDCPEGMHPWPEPGVMCVSRYPFYGWRTRFYGEDVSRPEWLRGHLAWLTHRDGPLRRRLQRVRARVGSL